MKKFDEKMTDLFEGSGAPEAKLNPRSVESTGIYQRIADVFESDGQTELRSKSGRFRGAEYIRFLNEKGNKPIGLNEEDLASKQQILEAFLQRNREFKTFVPGLCLKDFVESLLRGQIPDNAYKGVSYNKNLLIDGEKFDNLDFLAWAARLQKTMPDFELTILDASPYQVLNELGDLDWPDDLDEREFPAWFYEQMANGVASSKELGENCRLRGEYLRAMLSATGVKGQLVSALDLIKAKDPTLLESMREARKTCGVKIVGNKLAVDRPVFYKRNGTEFAKTYTPAVIAEAIYFLRIAGIKAKLGPTSEAEFDNLIAQSIRPECPDYNFFWYSRPFEKSATRENRIYFKDNPDSVKVKLTNPDYSRWVGDISSDFSDESSVQDRVMDISERVRALLIKPCI